MTWVGTVLILAESAQGDRAVVGSKHAVTDGPVVLVPDLLREFVVRSLEVTKQRLGWHRGAVGAAAGFGEVLLVVVLGEKEGLVRQDFGGDGPVALGREGGLIGIPADQGQLQMLRIGRVDG